MGDANGDGLADAFLCGASGTCYVVFGKADNSEVRLPFAEGDAGGFAIRQDPDQSHFITSVKAAGDVNGDGLADMVLGMSATEIDGQPAVGRGYVVFGRSDSKTVELAKVLAGEGGGFVVNGQYVNSYMGTSVAGVGDVNGDGLSDVIFGAPGAQSLDRGLSYVVFGKKNPHPVDLAASWKGFVINGAQSYDNAGRAVAAAGDVNGDGLADVLVTATGGYDSSRQQGQTYVVFGKRGYEPVELAAVEEGSGGGYVITRSNASYNYCGRSLSGAEDVNGDGLADVMLGCVKDAPEGQSYVVYGKPDFTPVMRDALTDGVSGLVIHGEAGGLSGTSVGSAGDVNGDGLPDLMVSAVNVADITGRVYIIWGSTAGAFAPGTKVDQLGTPADERFEGEHRAQTMIGGRGHDVFIGHRGADMLAGGAGADVFMLDSANVKALARPLPDGLRKTRLARVKGGSGRDTIKLLGPDVDLDLSRIARPGAGLPGSHSRLDSIERIDLGRQGGNSLRIQVADVHAIVGMNLVNRHNGGRQGWRDGSYALPNIARRHQLVVTGSAADKVVTEPGTWRFAGTLLHHGEAHEFAVYESIKGRAQLIVDSRLQLSGFQ